MAINVAKVAGRLNDITDKSLEFLTFWSNIPNIGLRSQGGRQMNDFNGEDTSGGRDKGNLAQGIREGREQLLSILSAMARDQVSVLHVDSFAAVRKHNDAGHSTEAIDEEDIQVRRGVTRNYI
ncbi:MAG: hypothetical protein Q9204_000301 [Flavoplaca sp. TL-2023a]